MSRDTLDVIQGFLAPLAGDLVQTLGDEEAVARLRELGAEFIAPDAEIVFIGAEDVVLGPLRGVEGILEGWQEWLSTFASYRIDIEDVRQHGDRVILFVRQAGRTLHGDVEVPSSPSAAVFSMRGGRIVRIAFYLDRHGAAKAEGFELP